MEVYEDTLASARIIWNVYSVFVQREIMEKMDSTTFFEIWIL